MPDTANVTTFRQSRRTFIRQVLQGALAGSLLLAVPTAVLPIQETIKNSDCRRKKRFGFLVDITACIGCGACCRIDRAAYDAPSGNYYRTWVERYVVEAEGNVAIDLPDSLCDNQCPGTSQAVREIFFVPKFCRMCARPRCREVCPSGATYRTAEGFVLVDGSRCTGCAACVEACPYSARAIDSRTGVATKCSWCHERLRQELMPLCVAACPAKARKFGALDDPKSDLWRDLHKPSVILVEGRPEEGPALYFRGWRREVV
jgi:Fe-S-cluster-containing dehydrogenase component